MKLSHALASLGAIAAAITVPAHAQDNASADPAPAGGGIAEIVVTAQKRAENVQDVPIAISAFTASALRERAVGDVSAISNIAPNVTLDAGTPFSGSSSVLSAYIRGIGSNDFAFNIDPGVGIYLDGVYLARTVGANQDLLDVERIEVLKGPQGTLFGRNTIGGAISIVTRDPGDVFRLDADITTGSFGLFQARGSVDVPISDSLKSSFTFGVKERGGYLKRIPYPGAGNYVTDGYNGFVAAGYQTGRREGGDDAFNYRGKLKWDDGGPLKVTVSADYTDIDQEQIANTLIRTRQDVFAGFYNACINNTADSLAANGLGFLTALCSLPRAGAAGPTALPPLLGVNVDADPTNNRLPYDDRFLTGDIDKSYAAGNDFSKLRTGGVSGTIDYDLSDSLAIKSITAYRELHWRVGMDLDGSPLDMLHTSFSMDQKQFSQEVQLLGNLLDNRLHYVLGGYYFKESGNLHDYVTFPAGILQVDGPNQLSTRNYAAFGQVDWRITDLIGITLGGRYTHESKKFLGAQSDLDASSYKLADCYPPDAASPVPGQTCQQFLGFPVPGEPLRYYVDVVQHKKFNNFSPKIGIQLHPNDDIMLYGSYSEGYKTGGWTTRLSAPLPYAPSFNEEKAKTFEVGVKSELLDRHLQINAAAFTTAYDGIQLNFQQGVSPVVQNAGDARIKGFEIEAVAAPVRGLTLNASLGYVDSYYTSVDPEAMVAPSVDQVGVYKGASLPKTPKWKVNVSPRYEFRMGDMGSIILLGDYTHTTRLKNDTEGTYLLMRPAIDIVNASATYRTPNGHWELTVGGTNITNTRYLVTGQFQAAGGEIYGTYSRPAEWYARLGLKF